MRARSQPSAGQVAMVAAVLWLVLFGVLHVLTRMTVFSLFGIAPLIVATAADERRTAVFAGGAVALTAATGWQGSAGDSLYWTRVASVSAWCRFQARANSIIPTTSSRMTGRMRASSTNA